MFENLHARVGAAREEKRKRTPCDSTCLQSRRVDAMLAVSRARCMLAGSSLAQLLVWGPVRSGSMAVGCCSTLGSVVTSRPVIRAV